PTRPQPLAEPILLIEALHGLVRLVDLKLHGPVASERKRLDRTLQERGADARATMRGQNVELLEQGNRGGVLHAVEKSHISEPDDLVLLDRDEELSQGGLKENLANRGFQFRPLARNRVFRHLKEQKIGNLRGVVRKSRTNGDVHAHGIA